MKILLFGIVKDIIGKDFLEVSIQPNMTISDLQNELQNDFPKLKDLKKFAFAINEEYAEADEVLKDSDIVAIIPPISGG